MTNTLIGYARRLRASARARGVICPLTGHEANGAATDIVVTRFPASRVLNSSVVPKGITHASPKQRTFEARSSLLWRATLGETCDDLGRSRGVISRQARNCPSQGPFFLCWRSPVGGISVRCGLALRFADPLAMINRLSLLG